MAVGDDRVADSLVHGFLALPYRAGDQSPARVLAHPGGTAWITLRCMGLGGIELRGKQLAGSAPGPVMQKAATASLGGGTIAGPIAGPASCTGGGQGSEAARRWRARSSAARPWTRPVAGLNHQRPGGILFRAEAVAFCAMPRWGHG